MIKKIYVCDKCGKEIHGILNICEKFEEENGTAKMLLGEDIHICKDCFDSFLSQAEAGSEEEEEKNEEVEEEKPLFQEPKKEDLKEEPKKQVRRGRRKSIENVDHKKVRELAGKGWNPDRIADEVNARESDVCDLLDW